MAGKRATKSVIFTHSGDSSEVSKVIEMPESGAMGSYSIFMRRISGTGDGHIETISGGFDSAGSFTFAIGNAYSNWSDSLDIVRDGDSNRFPYLKIELDFDDDFDDSEEPLPTTTVVELYITAY